MLLLVNLMLSIGIGLAQTQASGSVVSADDQEPIVGCFGDCARNEIRNCDRCRRKVYLIGTKR